MRIIRELYEREKEIEKGEKYGGNRYYKTTLAAALGCGPSNVTEPLKYLEKHGIIKTKEKGIPQGGKADHIYLTNHGEYIVLLLSYPTGKEIDKAVEKVLSRKELVQTCSIDELVRMVAYELNQNPEDRALRGLIHISLAKHNVQDKKRIKTY